MALYPILKAYTKFLVRLCYHSIEVDKPYLLKKKEAILIASNHPNSFLDAVLFDILFDIPVTSLARGDAFKNPKVYKILRALHMLPVYRQREGAENLNQNYDTFNECVKIFQQKEGVLIFSEGLCENEWHLRPLMKGTARLAFKTWSENVPLKVLPAGINYSSFKKYGKKIKIHFGEFIEKENFDFQKSDGFNNTQFNNNLRSQLENLVYEIDTKDKEERRKKFGTTSCLRKIVLAPFALLGMILHYPLYLLSQWVSNKYFKNTVHTDSIMLAVPLLAYPIYLLLFIGIFALIFKEIWVLCLLIALPFSAWSYAKWEVRVD